MPIAPKAAPVQQSVVVKTIGDYGVQASNDEWFAVQIEGLSPKSFAPGETYGVEVVKNAAGKAHIVKVLSGKIVTAEWPKGGTFPGAETGAAAFNAMVPGANAGSITPTPAPVPVAAAPKTYTPKASVGDPDKMSKAEWAAKDRLIARESAMGRLLGSQWFANVVMPLTPEAQEAKLFTLAEKIEAWLYRL